MAIQQESRTLYPKWSCRLLALKQMEQTLARQRDFDKAALVRAQHDACAPRHPRTTTATQLRRLHAYCTGRQH